MDKLSPIDIFNQAIILPVVEQEDFVRNACRGDQKLETRLMAMLSVSDQQTLIIDGLDVPKWDLKADKIGSYTVLEELGRGGMGVVYKARDPKLNREIAIKVLPEYLSQDPDRVKRFQREARLLASLNHPNIATILTNEESDGHHFITMEFVTGNTLEKHLKEASLPLETTLEIGLQITKALEVAHENGVIHRDLKPANVMVKPDGQAKVLDFGIAKALGATADNAEIAKYKPSDSSTLLGTLGYMSPEQFHQQPVDHRTDIWSFGCILYLCVTGNNIIDVENDNALYSAGGIFRDLESFRFPKNVPKNIRNLIGMCLKYDVDQRLNNISEARQILADELTTITMSQRLRKRTGALIIVIGILIIAWIVYDKWFNDPLPIVIAQVEENNSLVTRDSKGDITWLRQMPDTIHENIVSYARKDSKAPTRSPCIVRENNKPTAVVIATAPEVTPGKLWFLDAMNGETIWTREASWIEPLDSGALARADYTWQKVVDWEGHGVLAVGIQNNKQWSAGIQFITFDNEVLATYYHPGYLFIFDREVDLDGDGQSSSILFGNNSSARFVNDFVPFNTDVHCGCAILLETPVSNCQAFPYSKLEEVERDWPGITPAREEAYLLIPPIHPVEGEARVEQVGISLNANSGDTIELICGDGRRYYADENLFPKHCAYSPGTLASNLVEQGEAQFLPLIYIKEGIIQFIEVPLE